MESSSKTAAFAGNRHGVDSDSGTFSPFSRFEVAKPIRTPHNVSA